MLKSHAAKDVNGVSTATGGRMASLSVAPDPNIATPPWVWSHDIHVRTRVRSGVDCIRCRSKSVGGISGTGSAESIHRITRIFCIAIVATRLHTLGAPNVTHSTLVDDWLRYASLVRASAIAPPNECPTNLYC